jgi:hypothetical protein
VPVTTKVTARRPRWASPAAALVLGALILGLAILDALLGYAAHKRGFGVGLAILSVTALGLVVARRQPGNPIGWLLMGFSAGLVCYDAVAVQMSGAPVAVSGKGQLVPNPGPSGALAIPFVILLGTVPVFWVSFVARQLLSWRRATGERRQQLKWLMASGILSVAGLAGGFLLAQLSSPLAAVLGNVMLGIGLFSLPAGLSIGILKYRLYDIDRLISRTLSYTLVTGLLVGVYAGIVTLATEVLPFSSPVAVAASTLAVAALFNPLRRRVQRIVDRRFNRARYDADETVAAFAARLKDAVDLDAARAELADAVHRSVEPAHVWMWIRQPD